MDTKIRILISAVISFVITISVLLFWLGAWYGQGHAPTIALSLAFIEPPVAMSRFWDTLIGPTFGFALGMICTKKKFNSVWALTRANTITIVVISLIAGAMLGIRVLTSYQELYFWPLVIAITALISLLAIPMSFKGEPALASIFISGLMLPYSLVMGAAIGLTTTGLLFGGSLLAYGVARTVSAISHLITRKLLRAVG